MKNATCLITIASALALAAGAAMAHYENNQGCSPGMMGGQVPMSQNFMQQNRQVMQSIAEEPDLQKRRQMMHAYMQATQGQMMGQGMSQGRMMGSPIDPDTGSENWQGWMHREMEMMNHRLEEMQRTLEQLQQEQRAK